MESLYYTGSFGATTSVVSPCAYTGSNLFSVENLPFNKRVKASREFAGLTQQQLADACKERVTQKHIERMENRPEGFRSYYTAHIAAACGVNPLWLATGSGQMVTPKDIPEDALAIGAAWHHISARTVKDRHTTDLLHAALNYMPTTHPLYRTAQRLFREAAKRRDIKVELQKQ